MFELLMLGCLLFGCLLKPQEKRNLLHFILIFLLIIKNVIRGLFPDPDINISLVAQNILIYGTCFLTACYLPFYFYKGFGFVGLRLHVKYGVPLFFITPFFAFFVIHYLLHRDLEFSIKYGSIVPFAYSIVLSAILTKAIRKRYKECRDENKLLDEVVVYYAALPWLALPILSYFDVPKLVEVLLSNGGFLIATVIFIARSIKSSRPKKNSLLEIRDGLSLPALFYENCLHYKLTEAEIQVAEMVCRGMTNRQIGDKMNKSEETVKKQVQNILKKTDLKNRAGLMHKLCNIFPE